MDLFQTILLMKKNIFFSLLVSCSCLCASAQFTASKPRSWDDQPPEIRKSGFGLNKSMIIQMDDDAEEEQVFLFTANNGHYPYFDLFRCYYAVVGHYSKKVKFLSEVTISTSRDLVLEDRNKDGKYELYRKYIKDNKFSVDKNGNNLVAEWVYDTIEFELPKKQ